MNRLLISLSLLTVISCSSCKKETNDPGFVWTGQEDLRRFVPVCVIWYKQLPWDDRGYTAWRPYKCVAQNNADMLRDVILLLTKPGEVEGVAHPAAAAKDKLSLVFYNGFPSQLSVREVYFEIRDGAFVGPMGRNEELGKILLEQKDIRGGFYYPYRELGTDHYSESFHRVLDAQEALQERASELKEGTWPEEADKAQ